MRLAKYCILGPLLLVLLLSVALTLATVWLSYTESGLRQLTDKVNDYVPSLSFTNARGSLLGQAQFSAIRWQQENVDVVVTNVKLDITPVCFFTLSVCIKDLSLEQLLVSTESDEKPSDKVIDLPTVALPFELFITQTNIQRLLINRDKKNQFTASALSLKNLSWQRDKITFSQWRAQLYNEKLKIVGSIALKDNYPIKAKVSFIPSHLGLLSQYITPAATAGPSVSNKATLAIAGDLKTLAATFKLRGMLALSGNAEIKPLDPAVPFKLSSNIEQALTIDAMDNVVAINAGQLNLQGDTKKLNFTVKSVMQLPLIAGDSSLNLVGASNYSSITISSSKLSTSQGAITASGKVALNDSQPSELQLTAVDFNAAFIAPAYPSLLDLTAFFSIENLYSKPQVEVALTRFQGELWNETVATTGSLSLRTDLKFSAPHLVFNKWQLASDSLQLNLNGEFPSHQSSTKSLSWSASTPQLGKIIAGIESQASISGQLSGMLAKPTINAKLQLDDVLVSGFTAETLTAAIDIKKLAWQPSDISISAKAVSREGIDEVVDLQFKLSAQQQGRTKPVAKHFITGESLSTRFDLRVKQDANWSSLINCEPLLAIATLDVELSCAKLSVSIAHGVLGVANGAVPSADKAKTDITDPALASQVSEQSFEHHWTNNKPLNISWQHDSKRLRIDPFCLVYQDADICLRNTANGQVSAVPNLQLSGEGLPLDWLRTFAPGNFNLSGQWQFEASLQAKPATTVDQGGAQWQLLGSVGTRGALLSKLLDNGNTVQVPVEQVSLNFTGDKTGFESSFDLDSANLGNLHGQLNYQQKKLTGSVLAKALDAQIFQAFIPDAKHLSGNFSSAIDFSVVEDSLKVYGDVQFSHIDFTARAMPFDISQAEMNIRFDKQSMRATGTMKVGDGAANVEGNGDWLDGGLRAELKFTGNDIVIHPLPDSFITLAPDVLLKIQPGQLKLSGDISVSRAHIELQSLPQNAIAETDDVIIEGNDNGNVATQFSANIKARLSDEVSFKGFGLETHLGGHLQIQSQPGQLITGTGMINLIDGRYRAYGQNLVIEEGRMIFSGPLANPELFITAIRPYTEGDVRVGVEVTGSAKDAQLTLFSSPPKTENEILSYLLTGKAPHNTSVDESRLAQQMAISLGLAQTNSAARNIAESVGIEDFRMGTELGRNGDEAQMSGYIAPNLFLLYGVSMFDRSSSITARYELSSRIYVEVYSGAASAINIFWSVIQ